MIVFSTDTDGGDLPLNRIKIPSDIYRFIGMSLINRFGKSRTVQHIILAWINWFQVLMQLMVKTENYVIRLQNLYSK